MVFFARLKYEWKVLETPVLLHKDSGRVANNKIHNRSQLLVQRLISDKVLDDLTAKQIAILSWLQVKPFLGVIAQN